MDLLKEHIQKLENDKGVIDSTTATLEKSLPGPSFAYEEKERLIEELKVELKELHDENKKLNLQLRNQASVVLTNTDINATTNNRNSLTINKSNNASTNNIDNATASNSNNATKTIVDGVTNIVQYSSNDLTSDTRNNESNMDKPRDEEVQAELSKLRSDNKKLKLQLLELSNEISSKADTDSLLKTNSDNKYGSNNTRTSNNQVEAEHTNRIAELETYNNKIMQENKDSKEKIETLELQIQKLMSNVGENAEIGDGRNSESREIFLLKAENEDLKNKLEDTTLTLDALQVSENEESFSLLQEKNDMEEENTRLKSRIEKLENSLTEYKDKYEGEVHIPIEKHMKVTELLDAQLEKNQELRNLHDSLSSSDLLSKEKLSIAEDKLLNEKKEYNILKKKHTEDVASLTAKCMEYEKQTESQAKKIKMLNTFKKKLSTRLSTLVRDNKKLKAVIQTINE